MLWFILVNNMVTITEGLESGLSDSANFRWRINTSLGSQNDVWPKMAKNFFLLIGIERASKIHCQNITCIWLLEQKILWWAKRRPVQSIIFMGIQNDVSRDFVLNSLGWLELSHVAEAKRRPAEKSLMGFKQ